MARRAASSTAAWLLGRRAGWHVGKGREAAAGRALKRAAELASQPGTENEDIRWTGQVRRDLRALAETLADNITGSVTGLADWLIAAWPERATAEADAWLSARKWDEGEAALRAATHLTTDQGRRELQILSTLYPETASALSSMESVLDAIGEHGIDAVLADLAPRAQHADLVAAWLATPTWDGSRQLLTAHPELLSGHDTDGVLRQLAATGEYPAGVVNQHYAIFELCRRTTISDAYEVVTDPDASSEAAWDAVVRADINVLAVILAAAPNLLGRAFLAPALASCALLLQPHEGMDECTALMKQAAQQGGSAQKQALAARLRRLLRRRPDLAADIPPLIAVLTDT